MFIINEIPEILSTEISERHIIGECTTTCKLTVAGKVMSIWLINKPLEFGCHARAGYCICQAS
jgi:hypothetical protein